eukprot:2721718-Alexandrium_andersonii.AAC.1
MTAGRKDGQGAWPAPRGLSPGLRRWWSPLLAAVSWATPSARAGAARAARGVSVGSVAQNR